MRQRIRTLLRVISSEGVTAVLNRALDGLAERRRLQSFDRISAPALTRSRDFKKPPVINLSIVPPYPNRGGSQLQMLDRLREERLKRTVALLYPLAGIWRLEVTTFDHGWILEGPRSHPATEAIDDAVAWARATLGTDVIHIENLALLPLEKTAGLAKGGPIIIAVHDFSAYCRRPHLMEEPLSVFCSYSSDPERCRACLAHDWHLPQDAAQAHRTLALQVLNTAQHIIFPSEFLKDQYSTLFPSLDFAPSARVIEPATEINAPAKDHQPHPPHVAFVGGLKGHKGGGLVAKAADRLRQSNPNLRMTSYGDGDPEMIRRLKHSAGVRIHGYYRSGDLPRLLVRDQVDVAILPSIWPEAYGLVVDECLHARVPVVAFDLGAIGPRLKRHGVGRVAPLSAGDAGLAEAAIQLLNETLSGIDDTVVARLPTTQNVAKRYLSLYSEIGKASSRF